MGVSVEQHWQSSLNGKSMVVAIARELNVEPVRAVCEWLVDVYQKDLEAGAIQSGASMKQAKLHAENSVASIRTMAEGINDRNCVAAATAVIDAVFARHYNAGKPQYDAAMKWFADELRKRMKDK